MWIKYMILFYNSSLNYYNYNGPKTFILNSSDFMDLDSKRRKKKEEKVIGLEMERR